MSILEWLATLIGSHLTRKPTASPELTKCWSWDLTLATNFGSLCPKVTNFGSQNFGYQIWFCTRLFMCAHMPRACRFCPRAHKLLWLRAALGKWFFSLGNAHVLIFPALYMSFTGLVRIKIFFAGQVNLECAMICEEWCVEISQL